MSNDDQYDIPTADIEDDNNGKNRGFQMTAAFNNVRTTVARTSFWVIVLLISTAFAWICVGVLFWLYTSINTNPPATTRISFSSSSGMIPTKSVVSFDGNGKPLAGAGRSIYKSVVDMNTFCPKFIDVDAILSDCFLASYQNFDGSDSTNRYSYLKVLQIDITGKTSSVSSAVSSTPVYSVLTIDQDAGIFVTIAESVNYASGTNYVTAGKVNSLSKAITLGNDTLYGCYQNAIVNPYITRLSKTTFAISSFCSRIDGDDYFQSLTTQVGTVNPDTLEIKLSSLLTYAPENPNPDYHNIAALNASTFIVSYRCSSAFSAVKISISSSGDLSASSTIPFPSIQMDTNQFWNMASIDDNTLLIAYADSTTDSGITAVLIDAPVADTVALRIGSRLSVSTGNSLTPIGLYNISMDFAITSVAPTGAASNPAVAILYPDVANGAKWTAAVVEVTKANEVVRASPHFVLNRDSTIGIGSTSGSKPLYFEAAVSAASLSRVALFTTISDNVCTNLDISDFSVMEFKGGVGGISASTSNSGSVDIDISGTVSGLSGLQAGSVYVSDTRGNLIQSAVQLGSIGSSSPLYDYIETATTIVTLDAIVGIAVSDSKISIGTI